MWFIQEDYKIYLGTRGTVNNKHVHYRENQVDASKVVLSNVRGGGGVDLA